MYEFIFLNICCRSLVLDYKKEIEILQHLVTSQTLFFIYVKKY